MATYNPAGQVNSQFVSSLNVNKPQVYNKLFRRDPELSFFNVMREMASMVAVAGDSMDHWEKRSIFDPLTTTGVSVANGDGTLTFTAPAAQLTNGALSALVGNQVEFSAAAAGGQQGKIVSVSGATVTVGPIARDAQGNLIPLTVVPSGTSVNVFSNGQIKGSSGPGTRQLTLDKYTNYLQIFRNAWAIEGSVEVTESWFQDPETGVWNFALVGEDDEAKRHMAEIDMALLFSKGGVAADGSTFTKGLIQHARERGINTTGGLQAVTDFNAISRSLNKLRAPDEYVLFNGIEAEIDQNQIFQTAKYYEGINYTQIGGEQKAISLGFKSYSVNSYSFHSKRMDAFNHANLAGQDGFTYPRMTLGMPLAKVKDPKTGEDSFIVRVRNREFGGINRWHKSVMTGMNAPTPTNTTDNRRVDWTTECGLETMGDDLLYLNTGKV